MREIAVLEKRISVEALLLAGIGCGLAFAFKQEEVAVGVVIGVLASILNFKLLTVRAIRLTGRAKSASSFKFFSSFMARYAIMGLILWASIAKGLAYFSGAACGLLSVQLAIYIDTFLVPERWKV